MSLLLLTALLYCPALRTVNHTEIWNVDDKAALARAQIRCKEIYKDAPCLRVFIKKEVNTYWAICTYKRKKDA